MTNYVVSNGQSSSSVTLNSNDTMVVQSGGTVLSTTVTGQAKFQVNSGGTSENTVYSAGNGPPTSAVINGTDIGSVLSLGGLVTVNGSGATMMSAAVLSGGAITVSSGGNLSNINVGSYSYISAASGGTINGAITQSSGSIIASGGGLVTSSVASGQGGLIAIQSGASASHVSAVGDKTSIIRVSTGGTVSDSVVSGKYTVAQIYGGTALNTTVSGVGVGMDIRSGGTVRGVSISGTAGANLTVVDSFISGAQIGSGAKIDLSGNSVDSGSVVSSGGTALVHGNARFSNSTISSGGVLNVYENGTLDGVINLLDGATASITTSAGGTINLNGSTNQGLVISGLNSGGNLTTVISGFNGQSSASSDGIEIAGLKADNVQSVTYPDDDHVKLLLKGGQTISMNIIGAKAAGYTLQSAPDGSVIYEVCFLADTLIATPEGTTPVQDLAIGDCVTVFKNGEETTQTVTWVGKSNGHAHTHLSGDEAGYPIRVLAGAITENVPFKDMLITAEHCLFFDGKFVPARMLVNGRSIFYDTSIVSYDYYHVETEEHSVIMADGMLTESYLDTGNRRTFRQDGDVVSIRSNRFLAWEKDAAVPLDVSRDFVEPIFRKIETRADQAGHEACTAPLTLSNQSNVHLMTETGTVLNPVRQRNNHVIFMVPAGVQNVRLVSNASRPCDVIGPFVDDRRYFGVAVGAITLFAAERSFAIDTHLTDENLDGWNGLEGGNTRWTTGNARLPIKHATQLGSALLSIEITQEGPYITTETNQEKIALKA